MSVFESLNELNVNGRTEKKKIGKTELTYLSWPWAWAEVKKRYENAQYTIWKDENGRPYAYDPETGYMVYTTVTIDGISHEMWLPVMDGANNAMKSTPYDYKVKNPNFRYASWNEARQGYYDKYGNEQKEYDTKHVEAATMFDINKTIMRCLVKNLAMFGLGLYIYAGEDLPEGEAEEAAQKADAEALKTHGPDATNDNGATLQAFAKAKGLKAADINGWRVKAIHDGVIPDMKWPAMTKEQIGFFMDYVEAQLKAGV